MVKAICAAKKKNDRANAEKLADLLRVNLLPECFMMPEHLRELRRILRYRNMVVHTAVTMKNKMSGLLMEVGAGYDKRRLHGKKYFNGLMERLDDVPASVKELLQQTRGSLESFLAVQKKLLASLRENPLLRERVELLRSIKGVGEAQRFSSSRQAISYCGLCSGQKQSAGKEQRGPISKQRNKHLQTMLIEAAKLAPRWIRSWRGCAQKNWRAATRIRRPWPWRVNWLSTCWLWIGGALRLPRHRPPKLPEQYRRAGGLRRACLEPILGRRRTPWHLHGG